MNFHLNIYLPKHIIFLIDSFALQMDGRGLENTSLDIVYINIRGKI